MKAFGIVVAAGSGQRFGGPKARVELGGLPLWQRARDTLLAAGCDPVIVVGDVPGGVAGGVRRRDSVRAGLDLAPPDVTHVLVHDAARPLASAALARAVLDRLMSGDAVAVVPAVPVRDTIKRVEGDRVVETVERVGLFVVQTPQGFALDVLRRAHDGDDDASDDAVLVERAGGRVDVIPGEPENLKITYPGDLAVAEALLT